MEPIPLRSITLLLNYERMTQDPRFKGKKLCNTSISNPGYLNEMKPRMKEPFDHIPNTIENTNLHCFVSAKENAIDAPSTVCVPYPVSHPSLASLTFAERELIYHESHGHNGCYVAAGLFQMMFEQFPPGQKISIQINDEEPVVVDINNRRVLEYIICGPKALTVCLGIGQGYISTGDEHTGGPENHCIVAFAHSGKEGSYLVVDMSRMQYGKAGRGDHGEYYFLGTLERWMDSMSGICASAQLRGTLFYLRIKRMKTEAFVTACVKAAWQRWKDRKLVGWCEFCGMPNKNKLMEDCVWCGDVKYCCNEHVKTGWKMHQHTCSRQNGDSLELEMGKLDGRVSLANSKTQKAVLVRRQG